MPLPRRPASTSVGRHELGAPEAEDVGHQRLDGRVVHRDRVFAPAEPEEPEDTVCERDGTPSLADGTSRGAARAQLDLRRGDGRPSSSHTAP